MNRRQLQSTTLAVFVALLGFQPGAGVAVPVGYEFTYQGRLEQVGAAAAGTCNFEFSLWDGPGFGSPPVGGSQVGSTQSHTLSRDAGGLFSVVLDFGPNAFTGDERWLQVAVRCPDATGSYSTLSPRQRVSAAPYSLYSIASGGAADLSCSSCVTSEALADGAVTANRIAIGAVQLSHLGFTPGTLTSISAGPGLTGGTITDAGTIGVAFGTTAGTVAEGGHTHAGAYWNLGGNGGTDPGSQFLGTTDNQAFELRVNGQRALRIEPGLVPTLIGGHPDNDVPSGVFGAAVGGGGRAGGRNRVTDHFGTVCGGEDNQAGNDAGSTQDANFATVGGGSGNAASGWGATVAGGAINKNGGFFAAIGGGYDNSATGLYDVIGGGNGNRATAPYATIGGGGKTDDNNPATGNVVTDSYGTVAGGGDNQAGNDNQVIDDAVGATIGGGGTNFATAAHSTVAGGFLNLASGLQSTVPGGLFNSAEGTGSFAAGVNAHAVHNNSFVWSDGTGSEASSAPKQFVARATGGFRLQYGTGPGDYCLVTNSSGWHCGVIVSDRNLKSHLEPVDDRDVLDRLARLPVQSWNYAGEDVSVRHIGPTAQDFHATFDVGADDTRIDPVDANGVALAAIRGLLQLVRERDAAVAGLQARLEALEGEVRDLRGR